MGQYFLHTKINKNLEDQQVYPGDSRVNLAYEQGECFGALHFLALKVITQSTESMAASCSNQSPNAFVLDLNNSFWGSVLESMHYNLTVPSSRPLEAAWSIRCLRYYLSLGLEEGQDVALSHWSLHVSEDVSVSLVAKLDSYLDTLTLATGSAQNFGDLPM